MFSAKSGSLTKASNRPSFGDTAYSVPRSFAVSRRVDAVPKCVDKLDGHLLDHTEVFGQVDKGSDDSIAAPLRPPLGAFDEAIVSMHRTM